MNLAANKRALFLTKHSIYSSAAFFCTVLCVMLFSLTLNSCRKYSDYRELAGRIADLEGEAGNDERIRELMQSIRRVDAEVEQTLLSVRNKGTYWRLLALKYMDYKMWKQALNAFDEALSIYPEHAVMIYNRALCSGQLALLTDTPASRREYLRQAENGYRRSMAIDPRFTPAIYALAVILVFEKQENSEAVLLLEDYINIERSDIPARFLLARAYLELFRVSEALDMYNYIIQNANVPEDKQKAKELRQRVAEGDYGQ